MNDKTLGNEQQHSANELKPLLCSGVCFFPSLNARPDSSSNSCCVFSRPCVQEVHTARRPPAGRSDHAAARDAVCNELDFPRDLGTPFVTEWGLFEVCTLARTKVQFLLEPELGLCAL